MQSPYDDNSWQGSDFSLLRLLWRNLPLLLFFVLAISGMMGVYVFFDPAVGPFEVVSAHSPGGNSAAFVKAVPPRPVVQRLAQSPGPLRIGIISGHRGHDAGAVCEDGLTEAEVNFSIAEKVVADLRAQGYRTDLLEEFDERLNGYSATALVSIHADSCDYVNDLATGFKLAGSAFTDSSALEFCVEESYRNGTSLPYHANTITPDMTDYHAFRAIAPDTPAVIIETGFMSLDRELLTERADVPAAAITSGINCFLEQVQNQ